MSLKVNLPKALWRVTQIRFFLDETKFVRSRQVAQLTGLALDSFLSPVLFVMMAFPCDCDEQYLRRIFP